MGILEILRIPFKKNKKITETLLTSANHAD